MQRGVQALSLGTPIITSDWALLRDYFCKGTVHVDNSAAGIRAGVERLRDDLERYREEIVQLRTEVDAEWDRSRDALLHTILSSRGIARRTQTSISA
jgi:hypothetical protein